MAELVIAEGKSLTLTASFTDEAGAPVVPAAVSYRIDDEASGTEVVGDTPLVPAATVTIEVTRAQNAMLDPTRGRERRVVTVDFAYGAGGEKGGPEQFGYVLKNLRFVGVSP